MNIPCILIPALVGIICGILGYLIGKMNSKKGNNYESVTYKSDLEKCRSTIQDLNLKVSSLENDLEFCRENSLASTILEKKVKENDLKIIEGIGPKIEELYHNAGINTWFELSKTSVEKLQNILNAAGEGFTIHNPGTWARQAELAYQGKWKELKDWQDVLDGGKE